MPAGHDGFDDGLLHGTAFVLWRRAEGGEAEPAFQFPAGVVALAAPGAAEVGAGGTAQALQQAARLRELVFHPRRQDRVSAGYGEPGEDAGRRPVGRGQGGRDFAGVNLAGVAGQKLAHGGAGLGIGGTLSVAQRRKEEVEAGCGAGRRGQPVPGGKELRGGFRQSLALVVEDFQGQAGVEFRVVDLSAPELPVLVVLDEVVIGVAGEGEGTQQQRIYYRQIQQAQVRLGGPEVRQVESDQVVADQEVGAVCQLVEPVQCRLKAHAAFGKGQPVVGVGPHRGEGVDAGVVSADFEVERQAGLQRGDNHRSSSKPPATFRDGFHPGGASASASRRRPEALKA